MLEQSSSLLEQLSLVVRDVPRHHLLAIVKSYLQSSDQLSQKKRYAITHDTFTTGNQR